VELITSGDHRGQGYWVEEENRNKGRDMVVLGASESSNCVSSLLDRTFLSAITAVSSQARYRRWRKKKARSRKRRKR
jgi:hypothetical protein